MVFTTQRFHLPTSNYDSVVVVVGGEGGGLHLKRTGYLSVRETKILLFGHGLAL